MMRDITIENRWRQAWTRVLWKTLQRFSSTSTKWARTNFSALSILCGVSLKMTNIFEADLCGSFDCTSSSSLRSRQLWARACKFLILPLKVFLILIKLHITSPLAFFCFVQQVSFHRANRQEGLLMSEREEIQALTVKRLPSPPNTLVLLMHSLCPL